MRTKCTSKSIVAATVAATALLLGTGSAFALSIPGWAGKAIADTQTGCLQETNGGVFNNCNEQVTYEIPLVIGPGPVVLTLATYNPGGGTFQCTLYSASNTGILTTGTTWFPNTGNQTHQMSVSVTTGGSAFLYCNLNYQGKIYNVVQ